jgi:hypothetical protein
VRSLIITIYSVFLSQYDASTRLDRPSGNQEGNSQDNFRVYYKKNLWFVQCSAASKRSPLPIWLLEAAQAICIDTVRDFCFQARSKSHMQCDVTPNVRQTGRDSIVSGQDPANTVLSLQLPQKAGKFLIVQ